MRRDQLSIGSLLIVISRPNSVPIGVDSVGSQTCYDTTITDFSRVDKICHRLLHVYCCSRRLYIAFEFSAPFEFAAASMSVYYYIND